MNKIIFTIALYISFFVGLRVEAQDSLSSQLTLQRIIELARNQSPQALRAETIRENRYWQYRTFRSNYMPQVDLFGDLPNYERRVTGVEQNDGTTEFLFVNRNTSRLGISLSQRISATGARVFVNSELNRFDNFEADETSYSGDPVFLGISQPLFSFNDLKWDKRIEPLRYEESKREYIEDLEQISREATELYFDRLLAQVSLEIAKIDLANNDTIFKIAQGRYNLGTIAENELLQLELTLMNSRQRVAQGELDLETSTLRLQSYVGFTEDFSYSLVLPENLPQFDINPEQAIEQALKNRQENIEYKRRILQAEREVAEARAESGLDADLFASYGLTNNGQVVADIYDDPDNQQVLRVGFNIPIVDWGRQKARRKTAESNQKLVQYTVEQERIIFRQEIYTQVRQFEMLRNQIEVTSKADEIAQKRYDISKNRYLIGKIGITDLNIALQEKNDAKRNYIAALRSFWDAYFNLRRLTLYDFYLDRPLYQPAEEE